MKILLINPPAANIIRESLPPVIEDETGVFPPLGLLYIAACVEEAAGCSVQVLDCQAEKIDHQALPAVIRGMAPDLVGIQVMTFTLIDAARTARAVREAQPRAFIVLGGPHPTIYPGESVLLPAVDAVIPGEGERVFKTLVEALQSGKSPERVPGVVTRNTKDLPVVFEYIQNLDDLKMPARHLIDVNKYNSPLARTNPVTTMMSSRGCPYECVFCDRPQMGRKFRARSAVSVVAEMRHCRETLGIGEIVFYDDTFTVDKQRVLDICRLIGDGGLKVSWDIRARIDTVTPDMIRALRKAGCHRIHYGVESGSRRIQKRLRKNLDLERVKSVFALTRQEGIEVLGYFMIGNPDETEDDMKKTFDLIASLPMDYAHIGIFTPYPGTKIYKEALETGFYQDDYWRSFASNPGAEFRPRYWNQYFSDEELLAFMKKAYARFYSRPRYLWERLLKVRSLDELGRKGNLGWKLLRSVRAGRHRRDP